MAADIEAMADAALVAVIADGKVIGTGFVIDTCGTVLTCHHVIDGLDRVRLRGTDGVVKEVAERDIVAAPDIDLAIVNAGIPLGTPLPLACMAGTVARYWAKGYHMFGEAVRASFPLQGQITGTTSVSYETATSAYHVDGVLVMEGDAINPGLSGAPVLDLESQAVVGVVSTKFVSGSWGGGFAIPITQAAAHAGLAGPVRRNQETVAAYGAYLNAPAARTLCAEITDSEIEKLTRLRGVDLKRRVSRRDADTLIGEFLRGDSPVLAFVGQSGVGKSTELAALARRLPGRSLLLRGSSLAPDATQGLGAAIDAALHERRPQVPFPAHASEAIARAMPADDGLIIVLDALNEAPFSGPGFEEWIAGTLSWLRANVARLVISCRIELWTDLIAPALTTPFDDDRKPLVMSLAGFSNDEFRDALRAYGLSASTAHHNILRLPLVVGLCARPGRVQPTGVAISLDRAIEAYIEDKARSLATRAAGKPLSAQVMLNRFTALASLMWERQTDVVDLSSLAAVFGDSSIADAMVSEGILAATPWGCRFAFDNVADWLQGQVIDLKRELAAVSSPRVSQWSWHRIGPLAAALRNLENRSERNTLRSVLLRLLHGSGNTGSPGFRVVEAVLELIPDASPYTDVLALMRELTVARITPGGGSGEGQDRLSRPLEFWRSVPLPTRLHLGFLRQLALTDDPYGCWRPKDWDSADFPHHYGYDTYSTIALNLVRDDPRAGMAALLPWLDDNSSLAGGEATVAQVALGILYRLRGQHPDLVRQITLEAGDKADTLVFRLAVNDPEYIADMISASPDSPNGDEFAITSASTLTQSGKPLRPTSLDAVCRTVAARYERGIGRRLQGTALNVLIRGPSAESYIGQVATAYQDGVPGVSEWTLEAAASRDTAGVIVPILLAAVAGEETRPDALAALSNSRDASVQGMGDRAVRAYLENQGTIDMAVGHYAESRLWIGDEASSDLLAIIEIIIAGSSAVGHRCVISPLASPAGLRDPIQRADLFRRAVDRFDDAETLKMAVRALVRVIDDAERQADIPDVSELLQYALVRIAPPDADRLLCGQARIHHTRFAPALARMLSDGRITPPGRLMRQFRDRVAAGEEPWQVLEQIMDVETGRFT